MAKRGNLNKFQDKELEERPVRFKRYQYLFLIVCEDENTEPEYFEHFQKQIPKDTIFLKPVGTGRDAKGVVEQAIKERDKLSLEAKKDVDVVWAVFDKDDADENATKIKRFEDAFEIAKDNSIEPAYSNEVFELWLLLHLTNVDSAISLPRAEVYNLLQEKIRKNKAYSTFVYEHGNANILEIIYEIGNQALAISRAEVLFEKQRRHKPIEANSSTTVHMLVKKLLEWIAYYSYEPDK
ncbi:RloB family protein [Parasediminibacterium sp. JCM 36343]|uniref:RloB family protein n=1 Tax=Parasediminibacterium sp. JCM 36343 TaxID=3374279 RepID=UPI003978419F